MRAQRIVGSGNGDESRVAYEVSCGARAVRALNRALNGAETPTTPMESAEGELERTTGIEPA